MENKYIELPKQPISEYQRDKMQIWDTARKLKLVPDSFIQIRAGENDDLLLPETLKLLPTGLSVNSCPLPCTAEQKAKPQRRLQIAALMGIGGKPYCTATAIAPKWLLTAAHCVCQDDGTKRIPESILFGSQTQANVREFAALLQPSKEIKLLDPEFCHNRKEWKNSSNPASPYPANDLALIELQSLITPASDFKFAFVANDSIPSAIRFAEIAGFGKQLGAPAGSKAWASMSLGVEACIKKSNEPQVTNCRPDSEIIAFDFANSADSCQGDSGGPLYFRSKTGQLIISAIVSRGIKEECGPGGIYVTVHREKVREWIEKIVNGVQFTAIEGFIPALDMVLGSNGSHKNLK